MLHGHGITNKKSNKKNIRWPVQIQSKATDYGCENEKRAVEKYASLMRENYLNFVVRDSVFYISI